MRYFSSLSTIRLRRSFSCFAMALPTTQSIGPTLPHRIVGLLKLSRSKKFPLRSAELIDYSIAAAPARSMKATPTTLCVGEDEVSMAENYTSVPLKPALSS